MKAKKKTNHLLEEADKIEHIPEEKNDGREGQDEPNKAKKPRKNRFLARLRKTWARIIGCIRSCTCIQDERSAEELQEPNGINMEELAGPSGINMEEELPEPRDINIEELSDPSEMHMENSKDMFFTVEVSTENMEENQNIKTDHEETEVVEKEEKIEAEYQRLLDLMPSQEDLNFQDYTGQETEVVEKEEEIDEIEAEYQRLLDLMPSQEDLYFQDYTGQEAKVVETEEDIEAEYQRLLNLMPSQEDLYFQDYTGQKAKVVETEEDIEAEYQRLLDLMPSQEDLYFQDYTGQETKVVETEEDIEAEYQRLLDLMPSQEDLYFQDYTGQEAKVVEIEEEIEAEYQRLLDLTPSQEDLYFQDYTGQEAKVVETEEEIEAEYQRLLDLTPSQEDLYFQDYTGQETEMVKTKVEIEAEYQRLAEQECKIEDHAELKIKEDREDGLEKADSAKESQRASSEMPGPSHISSRDNKSSKGKDDKNNKGEDNRINIYKETKKCRSKQMSCSKRSSLEEETPKELYKSIKTSQRGNSGDRSDSCSLNNETVEELYRSIKTSQSGSSHDEEPSTSDSCLEKLEQPGEKKPCTVPLTLQSFTFHQKLGTGSFGEVFLASDIIRKECVAIKVSNKCLFTKQGHSLAERDILELSHESPFLIHGLAAFHTEKFIYYVLELATRGDLFEFIGNNFPLDTPTIQFIMAEVICGTQFLHKKNILHQDLKSENILLTADGHIKITDFGLSTMGVYEKIKENPKGTADYMAPELVRNQEYGRGVDYFAIGIIMYDMYTSELPFPGKNAKEIHRSILYNTPLYPEFLTRDTVDILKGLLCKNQYYRLGVIGDIKQHRFFSDINWEDVEARRMEPPAKIMMADFVDLNTDQTLDYMEKQVYVRPEDQKIFKELSFVCPDWSQQYHPINNQAI